MQNNTEIADAMKRGMRQLAAGVCVVSIEDIDGEQHAMTASSVTSVSDSPASLLVCINRTHRINAAFSEGAIFAVNVLSRSQEELSNLCADSSRADQRFSNGHWLKTEGKSPQVKDAPAVFHCECDQIVNYGTHDIVIGRILDVQTHSCTSPLIYFDGAYASIKSD